MYAKAGQAGVLIAHLVASGAAATGLTVTGKVWEISDAGAKSPNGTTGTTLTVTEIGGGLYKAPYTMSADGVPIASFATTGTADVKSVPASFVHLGTLDTIVTAVGDVHATDLPAIKTVIDNIHDTDLPAVKTVVDAVKAKTDNLPASPAAVGSNMGTVSSVTGAVGSVTAAVTCTDATAAKDDLANATDGLTALKAILDTAGVKVATMPDVQLAATQDHITPISSLTGIATATNVSDAQTAIIAALPAEAPAMITADAIADEVQTRTIARVTLVDTTTTNTDMRGTDGAVTSLAGIATATNVADGADEVIAALPAAAPSVADIWAYAIASMGAETTIGGRIKAFVTSLVYAAPPAAAPAIDAIADEVATRALVLDAAYDHAKDDTLGAVGALHDFDPTTQEVTPTAASKTGYSGAATNMVAEAPSVTQVSADAGRLVAMVENAGGHDRFAAAALETAPTGAGGGSVDMTPVTEAIAAIPAPTFDGTVEFTGTINAPDVTVNPTTLDSTERAAIAAATLAAGVATEANATANRNTVVAAIGGGEITSGTAFTEASEDADGAVIGITTPGATIRAYAAADTALVTALRRTTANPNGTWRIYLEPDADYLLAFTKDGYYDAAGGDSVLTKEVTA